MPPLKATCQCAKPAGSPPCPRLITQEDLLCDGCRRGCTHVSISVTGEGTRQDMPHCEVTFGPFGTV